MNTMTTSNEDNVQEGRFKKAQTAENSLGACTTTIADTTIPIMLKLGVLGENGPGGVSFTIRWLWLEDLCDQCGLDVGDVLDQFAEKMSDLDEKGVLDKLPRQMRSLSEAAVLERASKRSTRQRRGRASKSHSLKRKASRRR